MSYLGWAIEGAFSPLADIPTLEQSEACSPWTFGSFTPRTGLVFHLHEWLLTNVLISRKFYDNMKTNFDFGPVWPVNSTVDALNFSQEPYLSVLNNKHTVLIQVLVFVFSWSRQIYEHKSSLRLSLIRIR